MSARNSDRNLLFGIIAFQIDFISREALIKAMSDWLLDKSKSLGEILVANEQLSVRNCDLLEQMVEAHIEAHQGAPEKSLATLSSVNTIRADLEILGNSELTLSLKHLPEQTPSPAENPTLIYSTRNKKVGEQSSLNARFQIIRPHAEGGLGKVSLALDCELKREVAVKEIKDHFAADEAARARFTLEAEITGGLEHPGIVPVYGLGHKSDGQPFYAMRFIKGDSLKDACSKYHATKANRFASENTLELRKLLGRFIDVCNAIAYAHSRGVLHRDLKPGNIMLGKYGETLVVDWGLAKTIGRGEIYKNIDEQTLNLRSGASTPATQMGSAIGTPHFMSPEQAAGKLDELGPASDVYSLGATLYYLLTNRVPFKQLDTEAILNKVQLGEFEKPREVDPSVPPQLEAICLKAMALNPGNRYSTPNELAADIERWLADEPVSVLSDPWTVRLNRWQRKHPKLVSTITATLTFGFLATIAILIVVNNANHSVRQAYQAEQNALKLAKTQEEIATRLAIDARSDEVIAKFQLARARWDAHRVEDAEKLLKELPNESQQSLEVQLASREFEGGFLTLSIQDELITDFAFRNPSELLSISQQGHLIVWDIRTGQPKEKIKFDFPLTSLCVSPDGLHVAVADVQGKVTIRNLESGLQLKSWQAHDGRIVDVRYLNSNNRLITCGKNELDESSASIWELENAVTSKALRNRQDHLWRVDANNSWIISGGDSDENSIHIWDFEEGTLQSNLEGHQWTITAAEFSPDGRFFASAGRDKTVILWDTHKREKRYTLEEHTESVWDVCFSPSGQQLASCGSDRTVRLWNVSDGKLTRTLYGHKAAVTKVGYSPDGSVVASCCSDGSIKLWKTSDPQLPNLYNGHSDSVNAIAISDDGRFMVSVGADQCVNLWDLLNGKLQHSIQHHEMLNAVAMQPSGTFVAFGTSSGKLLGFDNRDKIVHPFTGDSKPLSSLNCLKYSKDGKSIVTGHQNGDVKLWDATTQKFVRTIAENSSPIQTIAFSEDGQRVAFGTGNQTIVIMSGELMGQEPDDNMIKVIRISNPESVLTLKGHENRVNSVSFSDDDKTIISTSSDRTIRIWNLNAPDTAPTILRGHQTAIVEAQQRQGKLISCDANGEIKIWHLNSGRELMQLKDERILLNAFAADSKGTVFAAAGGAPAVFSSMANRVFGPPQFSIRVWSLSSDFHSKSIALKSSPQAEWHRERMEQAQSINDRFAAVFHASWLLKIDPTSRAGFDCLHQNYPSQVESSSCFFPPIVHEMLSIPQPPVPKLSPTQAIAINRDIWNRSLAPSSLLTESDIDWIKGVVRDFPKQEYFNTLGLAHYRKGNFNEAIDACETSMKLTIQRSGQTAHDPIDLAVLVMANHRLGRKEEAIKYYRNLNNAMTNSRFKEDSRSAQFAAEAELQLGEPIEGQ